MRLPPATICDWDRTPHRGAFCSRLHSTISIYADVPDDGDVIAHTDAIKVQAFVWDHAFPFEARNDDK